MACGCRTSALRDGWMGVRAGACSERGCSMSVLYICGAGGARSGGGITLAMESSPVSSKCALSTPTRCPVNESNSWLTVHVLWYGELPGHAGVALLQGPSGSGVSQRVVLPGERGVGTQER